MEQTHQAHFVVGEVQHQPAEVGEPFRPMLGAHPRPVAGPAQDRYRRVEVEDVGPQRDRLAFQLAQPRAARRGGIAGR